MLPWFEALADGSTAADAAPQLPWETRAAVLAALSDLSPAAALNRQARLVAAAALHTNAAAAKRALRLLIALLYWAAVTRTSEDWGTCYLHLPCDVTDNFYGYLDYQYRIALG